MSAAILRWVSDSLDDNSPLEWNVRTFAALAVAIVVRMCEKLIWVAQGIQAARKGNLLQLLRILPGRFSKCA